MNQGMQKVPQNISQYSVYPQSVTPPNQSIVNMNNNQQTHSVSPPENSPLTTQVQNILKTASNYSVRNSASTPRNQSISSPTSQPAQQRPSANSDRMSVSNSNEKEAASRHSNPPMKDQRKEIPSQSKQASAAPVVKSMSDYSVNMAEQTPPTQSYDNVNPGDNEIKAPKENQGNSQDLQSLPGFQASESPVNQSETDAATKVNQMAIGSDQQLNNEMEFQQPSDPEAMIPAPDGEATSQPQSAADEAYESLESAKSDPLSDGEVNPLPEDS